MRLGTRLKEPLLIPTYHRFSDIPVPPTMEHLSRTPRGMPIPWVLCRAPGTPYQVVDVSGPNGKLDQVLHCACTPGGRAPTEVTPCLSRLREAVTRRLCAACGTLLSAQTAPVIERPAPSRRLTELGYHRQCLAYKLHCANTVGQALPEHLIFLHAYNITELRLPRRARPSTTPVVVPTGSPGGPAAGYLLHYCLTPVRQSVVDTLTWLAQPYDLHAPTPQSLDAAP